MKKIIQIVAPMLVIASMAGCASTGAYFADRGRDAADMVTCTVGTGIGGLKVRTGPVYAGLFQNADVAGLRGGTFFSLTEETSHMSDVTFPHALWCIPGLYEERFESPLRDAPRRNGEDPRHKDFSAAGTLFLPLIVDHFGFPGQRPSGYSRAAYFGQIEVAGGFIGTLRLGVNVVEIVDFALGLVGIDMLQDDAARKKLKTESNQASQAIGTPGAPQPER